MTKLLTFTLKVVDIKRGFISNIKTAYSEYKCGRYKKLSYKIGIIIAQELSRGILAIEEPFKSLSYSH